MPATKKKKVRKPPPALRAVDCRVEAQYGAGIWRAGKVVRTFGKSFHLLLDKANTGEQNPAKIKDVVGYWRPEYSRDCGGCKKRTVAYTDRLEECKECDVCNVDVAEAYC